MKLHHGGNTARNVLALLLAAMALLLAAPARAAVYSGIWDPTYGDPYTNLGWRGTATFFVPDACKPGGTVDVNNSASCGGLAAVNAATEEFYDTTDEPQATLATLTFTPSTLAIDTLRFVNGALTELVTSLSDFVLTPALTNFGVPTDTFWALQFTLDGPQLGHGTCAVTAPICSVAGFNDATQFPVDFRITEIPEPATPWLVGAAIAALAALRRRHRR